MPLDWPSWNQYNSWVCINSYTNGGNAELTGWKKDLCGSSTNQLITHQTSLFNAYKVQKQLNANNWWFWTHEQVWQLQNLMQTANCHNNRDCKLWVNTISNFLFVMFVSYK